MKSLFTIIFFIYAVHYAQSSLAQQVIHEKMAVHTDRNYYQTGEIVWFRIYDIAEETHEPSKISKLAYVELLDSSNKPVVQTKVLLDSGAGNGSIVLPASIATGRYTLRCYTNWMKNFGPGSFFHKEIAVVNAANGGGAFLYNGNGVSGGASALGINITPSKDHYGKREKVSLTIITSDASGKPVPADVSISVYRLDSLISADSSNIFMLPFQGTSTVQTGFQYPPEYNGHFVRGKVTDGNTRLPAKKVAAYLTVMDDRNSFYNAMTDANGHVTFLISKLNAADSIIVQTHSYYQPDHQIEVESPFSESFIQRGTSSFAFSNNFPSTVLQQSINVQATSLFYDEELNTFLHLKKDTTPFYFKSNMRYLLDDFTRFSRMEDVFREYIRPVGVTKRQGNFHLTVFTPENRYILDQQPLVLVDGLPVFNSNTLFAYDPLKVKTIEVVTNRYFRSGSVFPGVISMATYSGKTDKQLIDSVASVLKYEIVQNQRAFFSPSYQSSSSNHLPDFRTTLYWSPSVKTGTTGNAEVSFYAGDLIGDFYISVNGIANNIQGRGSAIIRVE